MVSMEFFVLKIGLIAVAGVGAQWLAWRFHLPAIVLMALAGLALGPFSAWVNPSGAPILAPREDFGDLLQPMISIAVAVILFEGGLSLNFREIKGASTAVRRLVFPGAVIAWGAGAFAAHHLAGLDWPVATLFAGIMVVTGPTVIMPLLRQAKLTKRPSAVLKWEGIVNDPVGALLAVFVYEWIVLTSAGETGWRGMAGVAAASLIAAAFGVVAARLLGGAFNRGMVPEFLKAPIIFATVLAVFGLSNALVQETGLVAVTAMGVALANMRIAAIEELRRFKENVTTLLVSGVFVVLTATLEPASFATMGMGGAAFIAAMLFIVRPLTVGLATIGSELNWREKLLIGWIAPRGIVAAAVAGLFAVELDHAGIAGADRIIPLAFAMVFATVVAHGFTISPLARWLGLAASGRPGVLIVGASDWSTALAKTLAELEIPVMIADSNWSRLRAARQAEIETYYGEILSEASEHDLEFSRFGYVIAATGNEAYNALVFTDLAPEIGRAAVFQLGGPPDDGERARGYAHTIKGKPLFSAHWTLDDVLRRHYVGWGFQKTKLTEQYDFESYKAELSEQAQLICIVKKNKTLQFATAHGELKPEPGDIVIAYVPDAAERVQRKEADGPPAAADADAK